MASPFADVFSRSAPDRPRPLARPYPGTLCTYPETHSRTMVPPAPRGAGGAVRASPFDQQQAALTELVEQAPNSNTPVVVEPVVADVDEIVRMMRFPGASEELRSVRLRCGQRVLDEHLAAKKVQTFIFETLDGEPGALDYVVRDVIRPALTEAGIPWYGLHAIRRGPATNLHELGVSDVVIQAILRHNNVSVTRASYILNDAVDPQSVAAMKVLESAVCNRDATGTSDAESGTAVKESC